MVEKIENNVILLKTKYPLYSAWSLIWMAGIYLYLLLDSLLGNRYLIFGGCIACMYLVSTYVIYNARLTHKTLSYFYPTRIFSKRIDFTDIEITQIKFTSIGYKEVPFFEVYFRFQGKIQRKNMSISRFTKEDHQEQLVNFLRQNGIKVTVLK